MRRIMRRGGLIINPILVTHNHFQYEQLLEKLFSYDFDHLVANDKSANATS